MIRQVFLALVLIAVPVAGFTGYEAYARSTNVAEATLGDLSPLKAIVADVQALAASGDLAGAAKRVTDWESAWDAGETAMRPLNPTQWGNIDVASDAALSALRAKSPKADDVKQTLADLMATLTDPSKAP